MYSIEQIADYINGDIVGDSSLIIKCLCGIDSGKNQYLSYIGEEQYFKYFLTTKASAVIVENKHNFPTSNKTVIKVDNAASAFSRLINLFHNNSPAECVSSSRFSPDACLINLAILVPIQASDSPVYKSIY